MVDVVMQASDLANKVALADTVTELTELGVEISTADDESTASTGTTDDEPGIWEGGVVRLRLAFGRGSSRASPVTGFARNLAGGRT